MKKKLGLLLINVLLVSCNNSFSRNDARKIQENNLAKTFDMENANVKYEVKNVNLKFDDIGTTTIEQYEEQIKKLYSERSDEFKGKSEDYKYTLEKFDAIKEDATFEKFDAGLKIKYSAFREDNQGGVNCKVNEDFTLEINEYGYLVHEIIYSSNRVDSFSVTITSIRETKIDYTK